MANLAAWRRWTRAVGLAAWVVFVVANFAGGVHGRAFWLLLIATLAGLLAVACLVGNRTAWLMQRRATTGART